ncbi:hypothetical protein [Tahibacter amnicola]|uniref:Uncharacterized protein n=1 Tax=Tahibacter amnicola TaxID=2976241 RepID=A0ABY6B907_9GAMM|nr:hypothetical protein [Tahibacter amnicola]UXI66360.1 hypothetical protein N4264_16575 [Tahibacter amnicola]
MNSQWIPIRTVEGQREAMNRRQRLRPASRALLLSLQGSLTVQDVREQFQALGDVEQALRNLEKRGLVRLVDGFDTACVAMAGVAEVIGPTATPLQMARQFMGCIAHAALGLRAFFFTLKLDRCTTRAGLEEMLPRLHRMLALSRGDVFAAAMVRRIDYLLLQSEHSPGTGKPAFGSGQLPA